MTYCGTDRRQDLGDKGPSAFWSGQNVEEPLCTLLNKRSRSETAPQCITPTIRHSGKGKTTVTIKPSVEVRGCWRGRGESWSTAGFQDSETGHANNELISQRPQKPPSLSVNTWSEELMKSTTHSKAHHHCKFVFTPCFSLLFLIL